MSASVLERKCLLEELLRGRGIFLKCREEKVFA